jgi:NTP pyrophosphatase (non-canonical NTP hydrolase)
VDKLQKDIHDWSRETFGQATALRTVVRLNEEVAELLTEAMDVRDPQKLFGEVADVFIVLCSLASLYGISLEEQVEKKMVINRARKWAVFGDGTGQHLED